MVDERRVFASVINNLIECPLCHNKSLYVDPTQLWGRAHVTCKHCGVFQSFSIDTANWQIIDYEPMERSVSTSGD